MSFASRLKNRWIAKLITRFPGLAQRFINAYEPWDSGATIPWTPVNKPLHACKLALVTTSGIHHSDQPPFNMQDSEGDPSFRVIKAASIGNDYRITHDYYDHKDAEKDLNIVLPIDRCRELEQEGVIGRLADTHYSFMGHIDGRHIATLISKTARQVASRLGEDQVDLVLLTPA